MSSAEALRLAERVFQKSREHRNQLLQVWDDLQVLIRLVRSWALGDYRRVPWRTIAAIIAAFLYVLDPLDLIPDWIPGIGFLDDAVVIGLVVSSIRGELARFVEWEDSPEAHASN